MVEEDVMDLTEEQKSRTLKKQSKKNYQSNRCERRLELKKKHDEEWLSALIGKAEKEDAIKRNRRNKLTADEKSRV